MTQNKTKLITTISSIIGVIVIALGFTWGLLQFANKTKEIIKNSTTTITITPTPTPITTPTPNPNTLIEIYNLGKTIQELKTQVQKLEKTISPTPTPTPTPIFHEYTPTENYQISRAGPVTELNSILLTLSQGKELTSQTIPYPFRLKQLWKRDDNKYEEWRTANNTPVIITYGEDGYVEYTNETGLFTINLIPVIHEGILEKTINMEIGGTKIKYNLY